MTDQTALHNKLAGEIVRSMVKPVMDGGGTFSQVWVLLESVVLGVCLTSLRLGGDNKMIDEMVLHVKERLAQQRLGDIETKGSA